MRCFKEGLRQLSAFRQGGLRPLSTLSEKIDAANKKALDRIYAADLVLTDVVPAKDVVPALATGAKTVLVAGPPVSWDDMCGAQRGAVKGAIMLEGWAKDHTEAEAMCAAGDVQIEPNHHHKSCGPMAGTITANFPVYVVENKAFGNYAISRAADLAQQFGDHTNLEDVRWWKNGVAPHLSKGLQHMGGMSMIPMLQMAQAMGDENHNHNNALTALFVNKLAISMLEAGVDRDELVEVLKWYSPDQWATGSGVRACLGLAMACAKASLDPIIGLEYSTLLSCMNRNGHEFGIRVAGLGEEWFVAPAPLPDGKYFGNYTKADSGRDMGDSAITETLGWGSFILAGAPYFLNNLPVDLAGARRIMDENSQLMIDRSPVYPVHALGHGAPTGLDLRRVLDTGIEPWINTGITHRDEGHRVIGRGLVQAPMECFEKAAEAFSTKYGGL